MFQIKLCGSLELKGSEAALNVLPVGLASYFERLAQCFHFLMTERQRKQTSEDTASKTTGIYVHVLAPSTPASTPTSDNLLLCCHFQLEVLVI